MASFGLEIARIRRRRAGADDGGPWWRGIGSRRRVLRGRFPNGGSRRKRGLSVGRRPPWGRSPFGLGDHDHPVSPGVESPSVQKKAHRGVQRSRWLNHVHDGPFSQHHALSLIEVLFGFGFVACDVVLNEGFQHLFGNAGRIPFHRSSPQGLDRRGDEKDRKEGDGENPKFHKPFSLILP